MLANPHAALEREIARLTAELTDTRAALIAADEARRVAEVRAARLVEASRRARRAADAVLTINGDESDEVLEAILDENEDAQASLIIAESQAIAPAPPAEPVFSWVVSPREAALFGEGKRDA